MAIDNKTRCELILMKKSIDAIRENVRINLDALSAKIDELLPEEQKIIRLVNLRQETFGK